jgi:hypothetical protein
MRLEEGLREEGRPSSGRGSCAGGEVAGTLPNDVAKDGVMRGHGGGEDGSGMEGDSLVG